MKNDCGGAGIVILKQAEKLDGVIWGLNVNHSGGSQESILL